MRLKLTSADGSQNFELKANATMIVGRAPTSEIPVFDPTISRRHAELVADDKTLRVKDLGSSNGTFHNGTRVEACTVNVGDTITFGKVPFKLAQIAPAPPPGMAPGLAGMPAGATIVRAMPVHNTPGSAFAAISKSGELAAEQTPAEKVQQKLSILLEVSKELGRAIDMDSILGKIVEQAYTVLTVDRVAIQLMDDTSALVTKIAKDKRGGDQPRAVPQSIARKAVEDKVALSGDAGQDVGFEKGASIVLQKVRSFICSPLMAGEGRVLGVMYVDNVSDTHKFTDEDLDFVIAFAGIAAVAIENSQFAERIRKEALARSNFERYFTPQLAQRIATAGEGAKLGGDKREVTVLFSDIRGFTALSETMPPADMAAILTDYFTEMVDCVFRNEGTLDKFIGDAVMAQWGAPIGTAEDPDKAMQAAIEMMAELDKLNVMWKSQGRPELQIGIGLNHGEAFAGNIGSEKRLEYTVIGDTVNTASRLCSAAGPGEILISEEMRKSLKTVPALAVMPPMELKGKSQPVPVYRVVR